MTWSRRHSDNISQPTINGGSSSVGDAAWVMNASHGYLRLYMNYWPSPWSKIQIIKRKRWINILSISQNAKHGECDSWMSINRFWLSTIITKQTQAWYMGLVLAMGPGTPPAVQVWTGISVRFSSRPGQEPDLLCLGRVVTQIGHKPVVLWPGCTPTAGPYYSSCNFGSN